MRIYIPTLGRADRQITLSQIPEEWLERTYLVSPKAIPDVPKGVQVLRCRSKGIARTRQWICDYSLRTAGDPYPLLMDDDLWFYARYTNEEGKTRLRKAVPDDLGRALRLLSGWITDPDVGMAGFTSRFGNNWVKEDFVECWRTCMSYVVDAALLAEMKIRFDKFPVCEDYHVALSLLRAGVKNRMTTLYAVESPVVNALGGCSEWRTAEVVRTTQEEFVAHHAPFATLVPTKSDVQGFDIPVTLRVGWKRAYAAGIAQRS